MKESFLHCVWQYKLFNTNNLYTVDGKPVEIIDIGRRNNDAGADFFNAKIKIDGTLWAGNVEIHWKASDWLRHNHQNDKAYDNVILHAVRTADAEIRRTTGEAIPQMEITYPQDLELNYQQLIESRTQIACETKIADLPPAFINAFKNAMLGERLAEKTEKIETLLTKNIQHWEEAFYVSLARSFGFGVNAQAFEMLAKSLPLGILAKHKNSLFQIEALLFGQAGLLPENPKDEYCLNLHKEYEFLRVKYSLNPLSADLWKMLRLRPSNFPQLRTAQFAALVFRSQKLFSKIIERPDIEYIYSLFQIETSDYWRTHYSFNESAGKRHLHFGQTSIDSVIINTIAPFVFLYGEKRGLQSLKECAAVLLENLSPENNSVIRFWNSIGIKSASAADSQALLHLYKNYCSEKKCLHCRLGHKLLAKQYCVHKNAVLLQATDLRI